MKFAKYCVLIFLITINVSVNADTGCKQPDGKIYSPVTGIALLSLSNLGLFINVYKSPQVPAIVNQCPGWISSASVTNTGAKCAINTVSVLGIGLLAQDIGDEVTYNFILCDLDGYTWTFGAAAGLFGVFVIRRRNKL
jgi:hypothetical protein